MLAARRLALNNLSRSAARSFVSTQGKSLQNVIARELQFEQKESTMPDIIKNFMEKEREWTFTEKAGDINLKLNRTVGEHNVNVEWQLVAPTAMEEEEEDFLMTQFCVTVEKAGTDGGVMFYCSTCPTEENAEGELRYTIGSIRVFESKDKKEDVNGYTGPEFDDLDDTMQEAMDQWLTSLGINNKLCDFIDATATYKEQQEYVNWLSKFNHILQ